MRDTKYFIACISKEHIQRGVEGNFIQVCHGKEAPLKRMRKGDYLLVYSSKISMSGSEKYQKFTALGRVKDEVLYQVQMSENFSPFRRNIEYLPCTEASIVPLIYDLEFITNKKSWGYPFRYGFFEINENDFKLITSKMMEYATQE